ncbi:chemotaxis protein, partial [Helicobacter sp. MIT 00-7814]|uniref:PDC sensor domain-containing protein n=1 Tax=unclassified Helicobacter TaxID=2593540 RepID=UPI000E1F70DB
MKWFSSLSIGVKLVLTIVSSVLIGMLLLSAIILNKVGENMRESIEETIANASKNYATYMKSVLDESIVLNKGVATTLNAIFQSEEKDEVDFGDVQNIVKNMFDNSAYATYTFLYMLETPKNFRNLDKKYYTQSGKFAMLYQNTNEFANSAVLQQSDDALLQSPIIEKIIKETKESGKNSQTIYVGNPRALHIAGKEILGLNIAAPIFDKEKNLIGIIGYNFDFVNISGVLNDPKLDLFEGDIRALVTRDGVITIHKNTDLILQNIFERNAHEEAKPVYQAVKDGETRVFDNYRTTSGLDSYASVHSFQTVGDTSEWAILVTTPKSSALAALKDLQQTIIIIALCVLIFVSIAVYFFVRKIVGARLPIILRTLQSFFRYLNHESKEVHTIKIRAQDELGAMGQIINDNISRTQKSLLQDEEAIAQSAQTAKEIESGNLKARIIKNPANPQLVELKNVLNTMLDVLEHKIGGDTNEIARVFDS